MKIMKTKLAVAILGAVNSVGVFAAVPEGFEELLTTQNTELRLFINDEDVVTVKGELGYNSFQLNSDQMEKLNQFLQGQYLKPEAISEISNQLNEGISSSPYCQGRRDSCVITEAGRDTLQYVIASEQLAVRVMVPETLTSQSASRSTYIDNVQDHQAVILSHNLGIGGGSDIDGRAYYQSQALAGMFGGFVKSDITLDSDKSNSADGFYVDEVSYNHLNEDKRYRIGYVSDNLERNWNGTNLLNTEERISALAFEFGNTNELEFSNKQTAPRYYFSVPASGRLVIERTDGLVVLERNVKAGQNYVSYSDLPSGINTFVFKVVAGEQELYREPVKIYNTGRSSMKDGQWDYHVMFGKLYSQDVVSNALFSDERDYYQYEAFVEGRVTTQLADGFRLGLSNFNTVEDYFLKAALEYQFSESSVGNLIYGHFNDGSKYHNLSWSLYGLRIDWSKYIDGSDITSDEMTLSNYFYQAGSSENLSLGYNHNIWDGNAYINYSFINSDIGTTISEISHLDLYTEYKSLMLGYSFISWLNSTIDVNATHSETRDFTGAENDEWLLSLNVQVPLGLDTRASYSYARSRGQTSHRASVGHDFSSTDLSLYGETGVQHIRDDGVENITEFDVSASANYANDSMSSSAFVYANTDNTQSFNASLSSNTIITDGEWFSSNHDSDSYLIVSNNGEVSQGIDEGGDKFASVVSLKNNGEHAERHIVDSKHVVEPLDTYREYQASVDDASSDYINKGQATSEGSSYPGSVVKLDVDMREIRSYISIFNDIEGEPVSSVECRGDGCVSVDELAEGVFKFRVSVGQPFSLRTSGQTCLIPSPEQFAHQNLGENFCMPVFQEEQGMNIAKGDNGYFYYYIGEFNDQETVQAYQEQLSSESLTLIQKKVGERNFVFIESAEPLALKVVSVLEEFQRYALENSVDKPSLVSN